MDTLDYIPLNVDQLQLITTEQAWHYNIIPKSANNNHLEFYVDEEKPGTGLEEELEIKFRINASDISLLP